MHAASALNDPDHHRLPLQDLVRLRLTEHYLWLLDDGSRHERLYHGNGDVVLAGMVVQLAEPLEREEQLDARDALQFYFLRRRDQQAFLSLSSSSVPYDSKPLTLNITPWSYRLTCHCS